MQTTDKSTHSENRRLRSDRDRFLAFAFAGADLLIEIDLKGRIVFAEGAISALSDSARESDVSSLGGQAFLSFVHPKFRQRVKNAIAGLADRQRFGPLTIGILGSEGESMDVVLCAGRLPHSPNTFLTVRYPEPEAGLVETLGLDSTAVMGLPDKDALGISAVSALNKGYESDGPLSLSFLELKGIEDLQRRLDAGMAVKLLKRIAVELEEFSFDGSSASKLTDERFGVLHEPDGDLDQLKKVISGEAILSDPVGAGVEVNSTTMELTADKSNHTENMRALLYAINKFSEQSDDLSFDDLANSAKTDFPNIVRRISAMRGIIARDEFDEVFQPIVELETRRVHHYEALARFRGQKEGSTFEQILFAENAGLIAEFDYAMCRRVVAKILQGKVNGELLRIGVNISGQSLETSSFRDRLETMLKAHPTVADNLLFEVTESSKIDDLSATNKFLGWVRERGFRVCLDDFGAGAAAFQYLRSLDVDFVKIDGSYIKDVLKNGEDQSFLKAIVGLCRELKVDTIAEMIEDEKTVQYLQALGVPFGQGYLLGRPNAGIAAVPASVEVRKKRA